MPTRRHLSQQLLNDFHPSDPAEHAFVVRMQQLLESTGDPFSRDHFVPGHFTASSFILSPDRQQILLIFHSKLKLWLQPGGHVDPADGSLLEAARREAEEEVGYTNLALAIPGIFDADIHVIPARKADPEHCHFDVRFAFVAPNLEAHAGSDALDAKWVPLNQVEHTGSDESVLRAVRKLRQRFC